MLFILIGPKPGTIREEKQKSLSLDSRYFDACKDDKGDDDTDDDDYIVPKPRSGQHFTLLFGRWSGLLNSSIII